MKAGDLNKRVTLQSPSGTRDALGERSTVWSNIATVWARVRPLSGRELMIAGQQQSATSHVVEIRHSATIKAVNNSWRVLFGSRILVVENIINPEEANEKLMLYCTEGMAEE